MSYLYINGTLIHQKELTNPVRNIQYRGILNYCNYSCSYCPFSKKPYSRKKELADRDALFLLLKKLKEIQTEFTFQIVPYGEALLFPYYWEFLAKLSRYPQVKAVGCQTNASFIIQEMLRIFEKHCGVVEKLRLWCSFHPTMISAEDFCKQMKNLKKSGIELCVGSVADVSKKEELSMLYSLLPKDIYFWLNQMDGRKKVYTTEDKLFFENIDPFFPLEEAPIPAASQTCLAGFIHEKENDFVLKKEPIIPNGNIFLQANGDIYACNISRNVLGNLYNTDLPKTSDKTANFSDFTKVHKKCTNKTCSCFLAYQNRLFDLPELLLFFPYPSFRIIKHYQAAFFDIDNTLVMKHETKISEKVAKILSIFSRYCDIYLATSLPYAAAMKKCHAIKPFLSGGIFAGGASINLFRKTEHSAIPKEYYLFIPEKDCYKIKDYYKGKGYSVRIYWNHAIDNKNAAYKITVFPKNKHHIISENDMIPVSSNLRIYLENNHIQITNVNASKKNGIDMLCHYMGYDKTRILTCGDSKEDRDMANLN